MHAIRGAARHQSLESRQPVQTHPHAAMTDAHTWYDKRARRGNVHANVERSTKERAHERKHVRTHAYTVTCTHAHTTATKRTCIRAQLPNECAPIEFYPETISNIDTDTNAPSRTPPAYARHVPWSAGRER
eukprot:3866225-Pleurochrysis_carterae.AAC.1